MKRYTADFETCVWLEDETFVWSWAVCEIGNEENVVIGNSIEGFMEFCESHSGSIFYFHNLKFDSSFILTYLIENGFEFVEDKKNVKDKTFTTIISDLGMFYSVEVYFKKYSKTYKKITFYDSLKIIPMKVKEIAKSFNLPISKLEIDYKKPRPKNPILTQEEIDYIQNDVKIVAMALKVLFDKGLTKMTSASNALADYKKIIGKNRFRHFFPEIEYEIDSDIRSAYKGGFTYVNPIYKEKEVSEGVVLDVNSLYPSILYEKEMPFGYPVFYEGKYEPDSTYNLYIQRITCSFELKKDKIPCIQIKNSRYNFNANEYLTSSNGLIVSLTLTNIDLKLFLEQYDVSDLTYVSGWKFKSIKGLFTKFIDKWIKEKNEGTITGNKGQRTRSKLVLNSLYGKFSKSMNMRSQKPLLFDDVLSFELLPEKQVKRFIFTNWNFYNLLRT